LSCKATAASSCRASFLGVHWHNNRTSSTSLRFTTASMSARSTCSCSSNSPALTAFASTSSYSSASWSVSCARCYRAGPARTAAANGYCRSSTTRSCSNHANTPSVEASSPQISTVLGQTFVVIVFFQDTSWSTVHTRGLRLRCRTIRTSVYLASNLQGATAAQYFKGNFEKKGTARRMDVQ